MKSVIKLSGEAAAEWNRINVPRLGASVAFYTLLSLAPLLVISVSIIDLVLGSDAGGQRMVEQIGELVGPTGGQAVRALRMHVPGMSSGLFASIAGFITLLFGASGVFIELRESLDMVWGVQSPAAGLKAMIRSRALPFAMVLGMGFFLLVSFVLGATIAVAGRFFSHFLPAPEWLLHVESELLSFLVTTALFALLYKFLPDTQIEWRDVVVGSMVTAVVFSIGKCLIGLYIGKAAVGSAYGMAASLMMFLVWVYYSAQIFFLGAILTRLFAQNKGSRASMRRQPATAPDVVL